MWRDFSIASSAVKLEKSSGKPGDVANMSTAWARTASSVNLRDLVIMGGPAHEVRGKAAATHARTGPQIQIATVSHHFNLMATFTAHTFAPPPGPGTGTRPRSDTGGKAGLDGGLGGNLVLWDFEESKLLGALVLPRSKANPMQRRVSLTGVSGQREEVVETLAFAERYPLLLAGTSHGRVLGWRIGAKERLYRTFPLALQLLPRASQRQTSIATKIRAKLDFNAASGWGAAAGNALSSAANKASLAMPTVCSLLAVSQCMHPNPLRPKTAETETVGNADGDDDGATSAGAAEGSSASDTGAAGLASSVQQGLYVAAGMDDGRICTWWLPMTRGGHETARADGDKQPPQTCELCEEQTARSHTYNGQRMGRANTTATALRSAVRSAAAADRPGMETVAIIPRRVVWRAHASGVSSLQRVRLAGKSGNSSAVNTVLLSSSHDGTARIFSLDGFLHTADADTGAAGDAKQGIQVEALGEGVALGTLGDDVAVAKTLAELHDDSSEWRLAPAVKLWNQTNSDLLRATGDRLRRVVEQNQDVEKEVRSGGEARTIMCAWH